MQQKAKSDKTEGEKRKSATKLIRKNSSTRSLIEYQ